MKKPMLYKPNVDPRLNGRPSEAAVRAFMVDLDIVFRKHGLVLGAQPVFHIQIDGTFTIEIQRTVSLLPEGPKFQEEAT